MAGLASKRNGKKGGRPKGTVSFETRIQKQIKRKLLSAVSKEFKPIMEAILDSAKGLTLYVPGKDGRRDKVYRRSPNVDMLKYIMDQVAGKASTPIEVEGELEIGNLQEFIYAAYEASERKRRGRS